MELDPCLFPTLGEDISAEVKARNVELGFNDLRSVEAFCAATKTSIYSFFTAVWSIVLHRYVELENLHFRVSHNWLAEDARSGGVDVIHVMGVGIHPGTTVKCLLGKESHRIHTVQPNNCPRFNTGVLFTAAAGWHEGDNNGTTKTASLACAGGPVYGISNPPARTNADHYLRDASWYSW